MQKLNSQNASSHLVLGPAMTTGRLRCHVVCVSHHKVSINLGHILIISWTHVKETQNWVLVLGPDVDCIGSVAAMLGDIYHSVMPCDAARSLAICISVRAAVQALHESFCTVLRSGFLHKQTLVLQPNVGRKVCSKQTADEFQQKVYSKLASTTDMESSLIMQ